MATAGSGAIPLRPLTVGELLDAATSLLRYNALRLLLAGAVLSIAEQAMLYPLRGHAGSVPPGYFPYTDRIAAYWPLIGLGLGTEAVIITLLGGVAAGSAVGVLLGDPHPVPLRRIRGRLPALGLLAAVLGAGAALCALAGLLPWVFWYLFTGLAAPALLIDLADPGGAGTPRPCGVFGAIGRSFLLVGRSGLRPGWIRLLGYLGWAAVRFALGTGGGALLTLLVPLGPGWSRLLSAVAMALVNTMAYATIGCLDVVLHLETRMRVEGLDLSLARTLRTGAPTYRPFLIPGSRPAAPLNTGHPTRVGPR